MPDLAIADSQPLPDQNQPLAIAKSELLQPEQSFGEALREYGRKMNPVAMLSGLGEAVRHPIEFVKNWASQNEQLAQDAETAWKEGRHLDAARHAANYLFNMVPGVGTASDEAGTKLASGDVAGGLADSAALATQAAIGIKTPAIAQGTARGINAAGVGLKAAAPDLLKGGVQVAAGEALGRIPGMGLPARIALDWPGARQIGTGIRKGMTAGTAEFRGTTPIPRPTPAAIVPTAETPLEDTAMLDGIAQGFKYKDFASVTNSADRAAIQDIANKLNSGATPAQPVRPSLQLVPKATPSGQDIIRGSSNIPLSRQGYAEAHRLADATAGQWDEIHTSPLDRAQETAQIIADVNPQAGPPKPTEALTPWYLGQHEGQPTTTVLDKMQQLIEKPDEVPTGRGPQSTQPGQSFNDFKDEFLGHVQNQVKNYQEGQKILNATHYRDTRVLQAWAKAGAPDDFSIDVPTMMEKGDVKPGDMLRLDPKTMQVTTVKDASQPGIYFARHGATEWNAENGTSNPAESAGAPGPRVQVPHGPYPAVQQVGFPAQRMPEGLQVPPEQLARLNAGAPQAPAAAAPAETGMFLRNMDLDKIARALRTQLNKGTITKDDVAEIISSKAGVENLRDQLGLKGRYGPGMSAYLQRKVF